MSTDPNRVRTVFLAVANCADSADRTAVLDRECSADVELRRQVEALLKAHDQPDSLQDRTLSGPAQEAGSSDEFTLDHPLTPSGGPGTYSTTVHGPPRPIFEDSGTLIGPYKLLQLIGEGGMGAVYMAEQERPVRRRVALKIIKPGMDSARVIARFEAERQALAMMEHQSIARVLDAGTTDSGRPYFVMELVHGVPITQYCDDAQLDLSRRLELFVPVCNAIQHAHQKGIIHRDIKPSNVLVTLYDGKPVPKVIDFGIAKATDKRLTERTMFTEYGSIVGTLEYMSPEQASMDALGVDTRSDVYSLGVLLYELMTDSTPLERGRVRDAGYVEILKRIKEEEPPTPSTRLSRSKETLCSVAAHRKTEPAKLTKYMRGELDWIVMKALEKDRARRYETPNSFARDIQNFLTDEPVEACPPSTRYRLSKLARKHRAALTTVSMIAMFLIVGAGVSTWQAFRATRAERLAESRLQDLTTANARTSEALAAVSKERDLALAERKRADEHAAQAKAEGAKAERSSADSAAVLRFFQDNVLAAARPEGQEGGLGKDVSVRKAVDASEPKISGAFMKQPTVEASVRHVLGKTYSILGEPNLAIRQFERSQQLREAHLGPDHPDTLITQNDLALGYWGAGRLDRVVPLLERTMAAETARLGPDHPDTLTAQNDLAVAYLEDGRFGLAIDLLKRTLTARTAKFGSDHVETLLTQQNLASGYRDTGRSDLAIALLERALAIVIVKLAHDHPVTLIIQNNLALAYQAADRLDVAIPLFERTLLGRSAKLGPDHPATLITQNNLALAYDRAGDDARAEPLFRETLVRRRKRRGAGHPHVAVTLDDLGRYLLRKKRYTEAEPLIRESVAIWEANRLDCWQRFEAQSLYGESLLGQANYAEAEPLLLSGYEGLKAREAKLPVTARIHLTESGGRIVQLYDAWGQPAKAREWRAKLTPGLPNE